MFRDIPVRIFGVLLLLSSLTFAQGMGGKAGIGGKAGFGGGVATPTNTFTFAQVASATVASCGTFSACIVHISASGSGNLGVVEIVYGNGSPVTVTSITENGAGSNFTVDPNCAGYSSSNGNGVACGYLINEPGGITAITVNLGSTVGGWGLKYYEVSASATPVFDNSGHADTTSATMTCSATACNGPTVSLTGSNDAIFQFLSPDNLDASSVAAPYVTHADFTDGLGGSVAVNTTSQPAAWGVVSTESAAAGVIAFK